jgi:predicted Zn-dependent protease
VHPESAVLRALGTVSGIQVLLGGWSPDLVTQAASQLLLLRHSRANEAEADEVALRLMKNAGIAAGPFAGFFDKISKLDEEKKGKDKGYRLPDVFQTHPPPPERAARARAQPTYPSSPALDADEWKALQRICG